MQKFKYLVALIYWEIRDYFGSLIFFFKNPLPPEEKKIHRALKNEGYYVIENFFNRDQVNQTKKIIDEALVRFSDQLKIDPEGADHRIYGANIIDPLISSYFQNPMFQRMVQSCEGASIKESLTLAARIKAVPGNKGSGGGWHRDSSYHRQIKAILYLSDTTKDNGAFQFIPYSHNFLPMMKGLLRGDFGFDQRRLDNLAINLENQGKYFSAQAGTLILVDTRGIHRGTPLKSGERYALTNYYWTRSSMNPQFKKMSLRLTNA